MISKEMKKSIVKIDRLERTESPFEAPEGYFAGLPLQIQKKIKHRPGKMQTIFKWSLRYALPAFCTMVLTVSGMRYYTHDVNHPNHYSTKEIFSSLSAEDLNTYIMQNGLHEEDAVKSYIHGKAAANMDKLNLDLSKEVLEQELEAEHPEDYM